MTHDDRLYTLIAELTYLCPLRCVYCSNPTHLAAHPDRLSTADWLRVFEQAAGLGALSLNLSGGEPLLRRDLEQLVAGAHALDLYSNLITSGLPVTRERLLRLKDAGLNSVQVSIQDSSPTESDCIAGRTSFEQKLQVLRWVKELDLPLTLNVVLHRQNLGRIAEIIALAESLHVDRLELANTQYLAWALENRSALLPSQEQLDAAREIAKAAKERLKGKTEVLFVLPDYYSDRP
ncbi:MAG TPA: radical SAM protein, partial [Polyangiaceae bacterium]